MASFNFEEKLAVAMAEERTRNPLDYQGVASFTAALACLAIAYTCFPRLPKGLPRLLLFLLLMPILAWVPLSTRSHSLRAILSFSFLWTCPSKLLLLCWDRSADYHRHGFFYFAITMSLPIRVKGPFGKGSKTAHTAQGARLAMSFTLFYLLLNLLEYRERLSGWVIDALYCLQVYLGLEAVLGLAAMLGCLLLGLEVYPNFHNPWMSASLSEFWSKRWNLVATNMLRETVYVPILGFLSGENITNSREDTKRSLSDEEITQKPGDNLLEKYSPLTSRKMNTASSDDPKALKMAGEWEDNTSTLKGERLQDNTSTLKGERLQDLREHHRSTKFCVAKKPPLAARAIAMWTSFFVSGLIHEWIYCCINQSPATGEVTLFFILHGFATALEVSLKRQLPPHWRLPRLVAIVLTSGFLYITAAWLFLPPVTRAGSDLRILAEFYRLQGVVCNLIKVR